LATGSFGKQAVTALAQKHFDLYINGVYRGVYVLIERIKRGKYRVNVSKLKETDIEGDDLTGGYIWTFDYKDPSPRNKELGFKTSDGTKVILRYPKKR
jgi:CotH protein.